VSRRARLGFLAACVLAFALSAVWLTGPGAPPDAGRGGQDAGTAGVGHPAGQARASGGATPASLAVTDLGGIDELRARLDADAGVPRLVLVLAPT